MPKRTDIETILVIGAGPIVIGQAAEFDYSGTQAVRALKKEGYRVVLVNSNPATIMTDPELADATYIEPLTPDVVEMIIAQERPDAILPTVGGQTALNMALALAEQGILEKYGVELIGANINAIQLAEDRLLFQKAMIEAGLEVPKGGIARTLAEAQTVAAEINRYPILIRPSFTLGGSGGSIAYDPTDFVKKAEFGLRESPVHTVLVEESVVGWKEFELEVMRDRANNFVVICSIENIDPMGVHTGDSITVAPAMTLTDREYQRLRDMARVVMQTVGVETGGSNVQFAVNPDEGRVLIIEMNPRVSRSSALASKATGFPIAKIAALLSVGYRLDELQNDITRTTVAAFEPSIDYVVTKIPRWAFEKFPGVDPTLGPQMKSVGEVMAMGRTFKESLLKGLQSLELSRTPYPTPQYSVWDGNIESLAIPRAERIWAIWEALRAGHTPIEINVVTGIDVWFLTQMAEIVWLENEISQYPHLEDLPTQLLRKAKRIGFGDAHIGWLLATNALKVREKRHTAGLSPTFHMVDTCAAEFESYTPYLYSSYESESEFPPSDNEKVIILGGGPNRIGQGIEFDYCCVHAVMALRETGYEAVMINCNPETVSTDYDIPNRLYFEPLTLEHTLNIIEREQPLKGVIVQFGGQTPLNLVGRLTAAGVPILGTSSDAIDLAEDRERFATLLRELDIPSPAYGIATSLDEARIVASHVEYPVMVRPSYVLGGRAMAIVYSETELQGYVKTALEASSGRAMLIDHYLEDSYEVDVDAVADGERVVIGGIMQHIEEAGVHSGDSACVLPPYKISSYHLSIIREYTERLGLALGVRGLMNVQYAIKEDVVYVLEVNPRASRTTPYVSKATGVPLAKIATQVILGKKLAEIGLVEEPTVRGFFVKEAVLPFKKFWGVDALLGPEMRSTGEVMGHASHFGHAFAKAEMAAGDRLPLKGTVFMSLNDFDKSAGLKLARDLHRMGFSILATKGTAAFFERAGVPVKAINKVTEGSPHAADFIQAGEIDLVINTPLGSTAHSDGALIRTTAIRYGVPLMTTLSAAQAAVQGIRALRDKSLKSRSLQEHYRSL
ncbi:MAG: carbamoyl-phosphate synthase (glutamine-hydrolyzing) [Chloroflexota bacterium]|nr:carbamoyl-phosphate synthase large subunit [Chloroflexota bacterium]NOG64889.1 carbamoyl-phosphate synthase large subunit [Chloroflexota bacterium]GIK66367.1 MAG: carbamoyl-phosphate synthase (glutamine-hydrolyzing) [Chloroflexota bacterium]